MCVFFREGSSTTNPEFTGVMYTSCSDLMKQSYDSERKQIQSYEQNLATDLTVMSKSRFYDARTHSSILWRTD